MPHAMILAMATTEAGIAIENYVRERLNFRGIEANPTAREGAHNLRISVHLQGTGIDVPDLELPTGYEDGLSEPIKQQIEGWLDLV